MRTQSLSGRSDGSVELFLIPDDSNRASLLAQVAYRARQCSVANGCPGPRARPSVSRAELGVPRPAHQLDMRTDRDNLDEIDGGLRSIQSI
jgi:hypothetical protein